MNGILKTKINKEVDHTPQCKNILGISVAYRSFITSILKIIGIQTMIKIG
jgi:hypothetical protein